jgi:membrane protease YdiL (CAAX protease family)
VIDIFWNFNERRLRALWRISGALIFTAILTFVFGVPFFAVGGGFPAPYVEKIVLYIAAVLAVWLATRFLDKRRFSDTGIHMKRGWWIDLGFGLLLGALLMTIIFLVEFAAGWITIDETFYTADSGQPFIVAILLPVLLFLIVGIVEELMFRGYLLLNLAEGFNLRFISSRGALILSWLLTSAFFGIVHAIQPNSTVVSSIYIALAAVWFGLAYVLTGSIAIPIGAHITWNFFQGHVFGFPVSGGRDFSTTFFATEQGGPEVWTGGAFGPEAGLLGLFAFVLGALLVAVWIRIRYRRLALLAAIADPPASLS